MRTRSEFTMNRNLSTVATVGFILTVALLVFSSGLSYYNTRQLVDADGMVEHTHRVISLLEAVLSTLKDAETGQRGFIITQEDPYLQPYHQAVVRIHDELSGLKELTADNPEQQKRLELLEEKVSAKLDELYETISDLKRTRDFKAAQEEVRTGKGKEQMDAVRQVVADMRQVEHELLQQRAERSQRSYRTAVLSNLLIGLLAVALVSYVFYLVRRYAALQRRAAQRAEHLAVLGKLLAGVAHEVRNPLAGIRSTVQLWERLPDTARSPDSIHAVIQGVDRLNEIVSRLLLFARMGDNDEPTPVSVNSVLADTLNLLEAQARSQAVAIERELEPDLPPVCASASALRQVFLNLATNALQAMPQGGRLHCQTRYESQKQAVEIRFSDTGPGIPPDVRKHLFDPFFTTRPDGTGLGLAICQEFLHEHSGKLEFQAGGPGATFVVVLPAARQGNRVAASREL
jgi:signal transduction histidine kinase